MIFSGLLLPATRPFPREFIFFGLLAVGLFATTVFLHAAEPEVDASMLPRFPAVEATNAVKTFQVKKGFRIELAAAEPLVVDPIAMAFDENGRLFVVEMIDYSERRDEVPHPGRIRLLEDTDGDGIFDKSTIYATNLAWPTAVICWKGGIFVGATPDILYLKDTHGDGHADVREVVFTGFAEGVPRLNVQALLNSFNWGLDNRIHGAASLSGGKIKQLKHPEIAPLDLRGHDFSFDPRTLTMAAEAGGGQHGLSFDSRGRRFACNNSDHIRLFLYDERYAARNPFYNMPPTLVSIAADGPAAEVYRISPEEPWRIIRTQWRVAGKVPGPIEGGGRSAGYFTGATGTTIYRGDAFPPEFRENAFVGDAGGNLVHRKILHPDGIGLIARRADDEQTMEFAASRDTWFRPVQFANAPDGCLYIADMYREVIEHPWSLPQNLKKFLDLNSGNDRGRIYRIAPSNFKEPKPVRLGAANTTDLVNILEHPNGWHRDTAARLLYERQDKSAVPRLETLLARSKSSLGRLHALHALSGFDALKEKNLMQALNDSDPAVREHTVRLAEIFSLQSFPTTALWKKLQQLSRDPDVNVRYQLALTLGEFPHGSKINSLFEIVSRDYNVPYLQAAVLNSVGSQAAEMFDRAVQDSSLRHAQAGQEFFRQLVQIIGTKNNPSEIYRVVDFLQNVDEPALAFSLFRALGDGLQRGKSSLAKLGANLKPIFARAADVAVDGKALESTRLQAIQLLGLTSYSEAGPTLVSLLDLRQSQAVQLAAVGALDRFNDPRIGTELSQRFAGFTPRLRGEVVNSLLKRTDRAAALLQAVEKNEIHPADLTPAQIRFLRTHRDPVLRERASRILPVTNGGKRQDVIVSYQAALTLTGDPARGKSIYLERCSSCHRLQGQGFAVGPDMVTVKNTGKEKMLANILDPNIEVAPNYVAYLVETNDEETLLGIIGGESGSSVTVRQAFGKETVVPRSAIKKMQSQGQSLMPEGLESGLTPQDLANLLEYISTAEEKK